MEEYPDYPVRTNFLSLRSETFVARQQEAFSFARFKGTEGSIMRSAAAMAQMEQPT